MVSLWGSKKKDGDGDHDARNDDEGQAVASGQQSRPTSREYGRQEPDERSRLLPSNQRPQRHDGYLDPDDPAVSPYNLWTIRFLRYLTVLFAAVTFIWWILLFVSIFVSPPGMQTRGSGFTDFSYTTLTLGNLLVALLFFTGPSAAMRASTGVVAVLLLADMVIILAVTKTRFEEGWVGITSVVWAALMAIWCLLTDRTVAWGKREEEERLTGRAESRRTLKGWLAVLTATIILVVFIIICIFLTATLILRGIDASLAPDGQRYPVDGGKYEVHVHCVGNVTETHGKKNPTILLESGEVPSEGGLERWLSQAFNNGTIGRYCYWDRPGYAWSDNAPSPHSAGRSASILDEALAIKGETGPWISVSAGFGSTVGRIWASGHKQSVTGIMLIDSIHQDLLHRFSSPSRGFKLWGYGIVSPLGVRRLAGALFNGRTKEDRVYGRSVGQSGKFIKARLQENLVANSLTRSELTSASNIQSKKTPLVVLTSGIEAGRDGEWQDMQEDLTKVTKNLISWDIVEKAPHEIWETKEGRDLMEKRLAQLVKASKQ